MLCSGAYLSHLRCFMESAALEISCWLWASCPAYLNFHYVLDSGYNLQQDKRAEAALSAVCTEGLSDERSLTERQTVFWLHDGNQTLEVQRGMRMATSTDEALPFKKGKQNPSKQVSQYSFLSSRQRCGNSAAA